MQREREIKAADGTTAYSCFTRKLCGCRTAFYASQLKGVTPIINRKDRAQRGALQSSRRTEMTRHPPSLIHDPSPDVRMLFSETISP